MVRHRTHTEDEFKAQLHAAEFALESNRQIVRALTRPEFNWVSTAVFTLSIIRASLLGAGGMQSWPN